jgi:hypothetical protein
MHPEIKQQWIDALRSGKYTQGRGALRSQGNRFCCLGVLCDILPDELVKFEKSQWSEMYTVVTYTNEQSKGMLPRSLARELQIPDSQPGYLAMWNDGGRSFSEIADWIEETL